MTKEQLIEAFNIWFQEEGKFMVPEGDYLAIKELLLVSWLNGVYKEKGFDMEVIYLDLKAKTPLELYFETSLKKCDDDFMEAFVLAGYTEKQLIKMNKSVERLRKNPRRALKVIAEIAKRCNCSNKLIINKRI